MQLKTKICDLISQNVHLTKVRKNFLFSLNNNQCKKPKPEFMFQVVYGKNGWCKSKHLMSCALYEYVSVPMAWVMCEVPSIQRLKGFQGHGAVRSTCFPEKSVDISP